MWIFCSIDHTPLIVEKNIRRSKKKNRKETHRRRLNGVRASKSSVSYKIATTLYLQYNRIPSNLLAVIIHATCAAAATVQCAFCTYSHFVTYWLLKNFLSITKKKATLTLHISAYACQMYAISTVTVWQRFAIAHSYMHTALHYANSIFSMKHSDCFAP